MVSVSPKPPKMTSWWATSPGSRTLWMGIVLLDAGFVPHLLDAQAGEPRRARGSVQLAIVMQLHDLAGLEMLGGLPGELHHEHGPHGEVGGDQHRGLRGGGPLVYLSQVGGGETGRPHHHRHPPLETGQHVSRTTPGVVKSTTTSIPPASRASARSA